MTCETGTSVTFQFLNGDDEIFLEIAPRSMQFDRTRGEFDYCQAEFDNEVAKILKNPLDNESSYLRQPLPVIFTIGGNAIYRLLWVPDGVTFGEDSIHIEFHDPQKYLTRGEVDWRRENVKLKDAYEHIFNQRNTEGPDLFNEIKFSVPEEAFEELRNTTNDAPLFFQTTDEETQDLLSEESDENGLWMSKDSAITSLEQENVYNIVEGHYAIDFERLSPWECITKLNKKFGVTTWAAPDGNFWVGSRQATGYRHVAAPDDRRVWKMSDYNVTAPRDPVTKSVVRGGWEDDPQEGWVEEASELINLNRGTKDFRIEGVAELETNYIPGQEIYEEKVNAKRDTLEDIAKRKMMNKQREQNSGYIDIRPELSGTAFSDIRYVEIGDTLLTIPPEDDSNDGSMCDTNIEKELFDVVGVQHELTADGAWNVRIDLTKQLDDELSPDSITTDLRYYDPHNEKLVEDEKYNQLYEDSNDPVWKLGYRNET